MRESCYASKKDDLFRYYESKNLAFNASLSEFVVETKFYLENVWEKPTIL